jgi:DNA-binding beta-propeller fold protein YncE
VPVEDPYNLYFTPDGKYADRDGGAKKEIVFRDPHTMAVKDVLPVNCAGVNHADFSPDGRYFIVTCEFSGDLIKVDTVGTRSSARSTCPARTRCRRTSRSRRTASTWYVADMQTSGVWILDGDTFTMPTFMPTGDGAHGLYPSRDSRYLYVANRGEGSISVISFATRKVVKKWKLPGRASPDMGGVSADGKVLWLSGRYNAEVYAIDTTTGRLLGPDQGRQAAARPLRLAPAGPLLPGPHRHPALTFPVAAERWSPAGEGLTNTGLELF